MKGKNAAYPKAVDELKEKEELFLKVELRQNKYLNNIASAGPQIYKKVSRSLVWGSARSTRKGERARVTKS